MFGFLMGTKVGYKLTCDCYTWLTSPIPLMSVTVTCCHFIHHSPELMSVIVQLRRHPGHALILKQHVVNRLLTLIILYAVSEKKHFIFLPIVTLLCKHQYA